jgi:hypothetical protein
MVKRRRSQDDPRALFKHLALFFPSESQLSLNSMSNTEECRMRVVGVAPTGSDLAVVAMHLHVIIVSAEVTCRPSAATCVREKKK